MAATGEIAAASQPSIPPTATEIDQSSPRHHSEHPLPQPRYAESLAEISEFSAALATFLRRHDDLQRHLESILAAVDSKLAPSTSPETLTLALTPSNSAKHERESETEIESLCATASVRGVRRYITSNLSKIEKLKIEVPRALKRAHNPANFVLKLFGRFYLQGIRAYDKQSNMIPARQVSVLVLEFYLLMDRDGTLVDEMTVKEAQVAASDWRKRLVSEGGLAEADLVDGRGLLLLIGCFGVPKDFTSSDIRDLIFASNVSEISDALRRSSVLLERVPAIIEKLMKNKKDYKAVDIIYAFGMESRFPPLTILASFVQESIETWNKARKAALGSLTAQMDASKRHLVDLRSVMGCLKEHKLNPSEILLDCPFTEKISTLQREISDLNKKIGNKVIDKRRLDESKPIRMFETVDERRDEKRIRFSDHMPRQHMDRDYLDGRTSSDPLTPMRVLDGAFPGHLYPPPYEVHRPLPEIRHTGGLLVDRLGMLHKDLILRERVMAERAAAQHYPEPLAHGVNGLFRQTTSIEGFAGELLNPSGIGTSNRDPASASDLYHFADAVAEKELLGGPQAVAPPRPSSFLF